MFRQDLRKIALAACIAAAASMGAARAADQPSYIFTTWSAGIVGTCLIAKTHLTTDCTPAPSEYGYVPPAEFAEKYLNNRPIPDMPAGEHVVVLSKLDGPPEGSPPAAADTAITDLHLQELQREYYPRAALAARTEGRASVDCTVQDDGRPSSCWVTQETPAGVGFGVATLNVISLMKLAAPLPADRKQHFDMAWQIPGPTDQVFVTCTITPEALTSDCTTDPDPDHPGAADAVLHVLGEHPLRLAGAPAGQRIEIALLRPELGKPQTAGSESADATHYRPVHLTSLNANDVAYYYPPISLRLGETGPTDVQCKVTDDGRLNECWVMHMVHDRLAEAHLRMTEVMRMQPPTAAAPVYDKRIFMFRVVWAQTLPTPPPPSR